MRKKSLFTGIVTFVLMFTYIFGFSEAVNNTTVKAASEVSMIYPMSALLLDCGLGKMITTLTTIDALIF